MIARRRAAPAASQSASGGPDIVRRVSSSRVNCARCTRTHTRQCTPRRNRSRVSRSRVLFSRAHAVRRLTLAPVRVFFSRSYFLSPFLFIYFHSGLFPPRPWFCFRSRDKTIFFYTIFFSNRTCLCAVSGVFFFITAMVRSYLPLFDDGRRSRCFGGGFARTEIARFSDSCRR